MRRLALIAPRNLCPPGRFVATTTKSTIVVSPAIFATTQVARDVICPGTCPRTSPQDSLPRASFHATFVTSFSRGQTTYPVTFVASTFLPAPMSLPQLTPDLGVNFSLISNLFGTSLLSLDTQVDKPYPPPEQVPNSPHPRSSISNRFSQPALLVFLLTYCGDFSSTIRRAPPFPCVDSYPVGIYLVNDDDLSVMVDGDWSVLHEFSDEEKRALPTAFESALYFRFTSP